MPLLRMVASSSGAESNFDGKHYPGPLFTDVPSLRPGPAPSHSNDARLPQNKGCHKWAVETFQKLVEIQNHEFFRSRFFYSMLFLWQEKYNLFVCFDRIPILPHSCSSDFFFLSSGVQKATEELYSFPHECHDCAK